MICFVHARTARGIEFYFGINVVCVLGWRSDIYFGNCVRMMGVGQGFEICFGN